MKWHSRCPAREGRVGAEVEVEPCAQDKTLPPPLTEPPCPPSLLMMGEGRALSRGSGVLWPPSQTANCIPQGEQGPIPASEAISSWASLSLTSLLANFPPLIWKVERGKRPTWRRGSCGQMSSCPRTRGLAKSVLLPLSGRWGGGPQGAVAQSQGLRGLPLFCQPLRTYWLMVPAGPWFPHFNARSVTPAVISQESRSHLGGK